MHKMNYFSMANALNVVKSQVYNLFLAVKHYSIAVKQFLWQFKMGVPAVDKLRMLWQEIYRH